MKKTITYLLIQLLLHSGLAVQAQHWSGFNDDNTPGSLAPSNDESLSREGRVAIGVRGSNRMPNTHLHVKRGNDNEYSEPLWVDGRLRSNSPSGGLWLSNTNDGFVGNNGDYIGLYTPSVGFGFQMKKTNGYVGIGGTPSPNALLSLGSGLNNTKLALWDNGIDLNKFGLGIQSNQFRFHVGSPAGRFTFLNGEAGDELMTINGNGRVGIGTSSPPVGYHLAVNGKIIAKEIKVTITELGDYVFSPAYRLRSLAEVETFILQNGHLPEVPSAAEVAREGMNVGEMENTLLKKVEELTLYVIELEKKSVRQAEQIKLMKAPRRR